VQRIYFILFIAILTCGCSHMKYSYDENGVRYKCISDQDGANINWLFIPGGPGADSQYLSSLVDVLDLPGKVWLIDLPGNGDNPAPINYNYRQWFELMPTIVSRFENCIIVGHSLGGMLPLLAPELEDQLLGLVIINSSPCLWMKESERLFKKRGIPELPERNAFFKNKTQENYNRVLKAYIPYYFNKNAVERGEELFKNLPFPVHTMLTVFTLMQEIQYTAKWIPQRVPTLIIGGDRDYINPYSLYENDKRFDRDNIQKILIKDCGHWCWIEKPDAVRKIFSEFIANRLKNRVNH
jgi:pimeloyl-ACP methyl ester carboxylesterase